MIFNLMSIDNGEIPMTDLYTKSALAVIAVALIAIACRGFSFVDLAQASYAPVQKVQICNRSGHACGDVSRKWGLEVDSH